MKTSICIVAARRTPFGSFGGSLKSLSATDLAVHAAQAALGAAKIAPTAIDQIVFGNVQQTSPDAIYLARHVGLRAGVPIPVPALTVNRLCGSGLEAIALAAQWINLGEAEVVLAGGSESMSQAPYVLRGARWGQRLGHGEVEDSLTKALVDSYTGDPMAITAENLALQYGISRETCDAFALRSQRLAAQAQQSGAFRDELAPIEVASGKTKTLLERDEHARADSSLEALAKLKPVFKKDGVVTDGNASGMVDGAAAVVVASRARAEKEGWTILGEFLGATSVGCEPRVMGIGPVPAVKRLLQKTGLELKAFDRVEINEAFAAQTLSVLKELPFDDAKVNANGGAIAIGHPLGASGTRIAAHLLFDLRRRGGGLGLATACIGGGQGIAAAFRVV